MRTTLPCCRRAALLGMLGLAPVLGACEPDGAEKPAATGSAGDDGAGSEPGPVAELCNGLDDDGDGEIDEDLPQIEHHADRDGDGAGDPDTVETDCAVPEGRTRAAGDCDDGDASRSPDADERCNGVDDDCDGEIDGPTSVDARVRYPDADGDGYGLAAVRVCETSSVGWLDTATALDCDDADPLVHPGAVERCNAQDDDCDPETTEANTARFEGEDGSLADWGPALAGRQVQVLRPGTLALCPGTFSAVLRPRADLRIVAAFPDEPRPVLDASGLDGPALVLRDAGLSVELEGVDIVGGQGTSAVLGEMLGGAAVACEGASALQIVDATITPGQAEVGAGLLVAGGCEVDAVEVELRGGTATWAGGLGAVLGGSLRFTDSALAAGAAPIGGGFVVVGWSGPARLELDDTELRGCIASRLGGGIYIEDATVACAGTTPGAAGLQSNGATEGGAAWLGPGASLELAGCDLGAAGTDNTPDDLSSHALSPAGLSFDGVVDSTCTPEGCP